MSKHHANEVLATLEVLGFDSIRGVVGVRRPDGSGDFDNLVPTINEVYILHVRFPGGIPFCITLDGETFERVGDPLLSGILKKSEELLVSRSKPPPAMKSTPPSRT